MITVSGERFAFDVFLSHNRADKPWVRRLYTLLRTHGVRVFFDEESIKFGEPVVPALDEALDGSKHIILVITPDSMASRWVGLESAAIISSDPNGSRLIPLILEPTPTKLIPATIRGLNRVDLTDADTRDTRLRKLLNQIGIAATAEIALPDWPSPSEVLSDPNPRPPRVADPRDPRRKVLWQVAYAFLRLDQLSSGGWAKSLPGWLEALLEGPDDVVISADTRTKGGTDLTSRAFLTYLKFLRRFKCDKSTTDAVPSKTQIACAVRDNIAGRIGWDGGVGVGKLGRVAHHIRHTLMGLLTFLYISECTENFPENYISRIEEYLRNNLPKWSTDKSHPFACFCILAKVREKLDEMDFAGVWDPEPLIQVIDKVLPEMERSLCDWEPFELVPHGTCRLPPSDFVFKPYEGIWRMERSNLLMYLPLLVREDGREFNFKNPRLQNTIARELEFVVLDVAPLPDGLQGRCVHYHRDAAKDGGHPLDFGLTAELLSVLTLPAIRGLKTLIDKSVQLLCDDLEAALILGLGHYHDWPIFKFTQSLSLGQYLEVIDKGLVSPEAIRDLDVRIDKVIKGAVTECELDALCRAIVQDAFGNQPVDAELLVPGIRDMLVTKLVSGEHIPKDGDASPVLHSAPGIGDWRDKVHDAIDGTIRFFDGPGGEEYAKRYELEPIEDYVAGICRRVKDEESRKLKVLDIGCGPGQYARLFNRRKQQHKIELVDASIQMLRRAHQNIYETVPSDGELKPKRIENLRNDYPQGEMFDIVFVCAMMIHVPRHKAPEVYREFYRLIRPGGALFVNFKIGDHTLIGIGNRYHEYYRDYRIPWRMLEEAGFLVDEISMTFNRETMYRDTRRIHWANFFCNRAESGSQSAGLK